MLLQHGGTIVVSNVLFFCGVLNLVFATSTLTVVRDVYNKPSTDPVTDAIRDIIDVNPRAQIIYVVSAISIGLALLLVYFFTGTIGRLYVIDFIIVLAHFAADAAMTQWWHAYGGCGAVQSLYLAASRFTMFLCNMWASSNVIMAPQDPGTTRTATTVWPG